MVLVLAVVTVALAGILLAIVVVSAVIIATMLLMATVIMLALSIIMDMTVGTGFGAMFAVALLIFFGVILVRGEGSNYEVGASSHGYKSKVGVELS